MLIRAWIYTLAGLTFAITGWNLGTFLLVELGLNSLSTPEAVLIATVTATLAVGLILTEVLLSNPTRIRQSLTLSFLPLAFSASFGSLLGVIVGLIILLVRNPSISDFFNFTPEWIRWLGWFLVGLAVTGAETLAWLQRSLEAKNRKRFTQRLVTCFGASLFASYFAASLFEAFKNSGALEAIPNLELYQEGMGLGIFGALLGLALGLSTSPSYFCALRAGAGFEFYGDGIPSPNKIQGRLSFVGEEDETIEEGLSIELPSRGEIRIGSDPNAEIHIQGLAPCLATLKLQQRDVYLCPSKNAPYKDIQINGSPCFSHKSILLRHNTILSFYPPKTDEPPSELPPTSTSPTFYRFIYYNRFLDPLA